MKAVWYSFRQLLSCMKMDRMLVLSFAVPLLYGVAVQFGIPAAEKLIDTYFYRPDFLHPYYDLFDLFLAAITPIMFCFIPAMVILEETDDHIAGYFSVTPLGKKGYLISRLGIPAMIAFLMSIAVVLVFRLHSWGFAMTLLACAAGTCHGILSALLVVSFSTNKIEGLAVTKMTSLLILGIPAPFFLSDPAQFLLFPLPSFWMAKAVLSDNPLLMAVSLALAAIWIWLLSGKFYHKLNS